MKPSPFTYHRAATVDGALDLLAEVGDDAKVIAGGQSLVPLLNFRLAAPEHLVDITRIPGLDEIEVGEEGVRIGAMARHSAVERHAGAAEAVPVLAQALRHVAHPVIRNRGTVCGSLAHADPAGELPAVLALLDGSVRVATRAGTRDVPADRFFVGPLECLLGPDELVVSAWFPRMGPGTGSAVQELARRRGDYAMAGAAALVSLDASGELASARVAMFAVGPTPLVLDVTDAAASGDVRRDVSARVSPTEDLHASAAYRRHLAGVLAGRAVAAALGRARVAVAA